MNKISKSFGEVAVLKSIDLKLEKGQLLGLVGENGAGKSTLMNILGGLFAPSRGTMELNAEPFIPNSPNDALKAGIAFVHQELNLFTNLTVMENLFISDFPKKSMLGLSFLDRKKAIRKTDELLSEMGLSISPLAKVDQLTAAQQQLLEITKILNNSPQIIIFDEPTTSLTRYETEKLFSLIRKLKADGTGIIYISHNLEDVMLLADQIMVLRDGQLICQEDKTALSIPKLVKAMVGRDLDQYFPSRTTMPAEENLLEVKHLFGGLVQEVSFSIRKQEVLGFYGLVGAGRSELARLLYGLDPFTSGNIRWKRNKISKPSPTKWVHEGMAFLTENRREEGLMIQQSIEKNIQLAGLTKERSLGNLIPKQIIKNKVRQQANANKIKYHDISRQAVATLSGGNQQKVVLAKWLLLGPELLILDEPTKGIDIGARHEIYTLTNNLVKAGSSILLISSDIEELIGLCDRILVMSEGRLTKEFQKGSFDRSNILAAALHGQEKDEKR
ncbi:sugar ABC transporter ATP-binding protein [Poritiphilus flavus]|uniref:ATP-binding cassette domain-containing protein n=1 Tax=Poritiphilus flavus TaxID=2697053 RepID=A0A6L9E7K6_9FLAO|nr:sugar ABC transporter ATP-binding protein [Poritiphilus flavus]NAS10621.1 ATP-binding cassette domain-containing protein [Poritiphilus flavus]